MAEALIKINNQLEKSREDLNDRLSGKIPQNIKKPLIHHKKHKQPDDKEIEFNKRLNEMKQRELLLKEKEEAFRINEEKLKILKKYKLLNNGMLMPFIGLGTSRIGGDPKDPNKKGLKDVKDIVYNAIKLGIRLFDTAFKYQNEEQVGEGIKNAHNDGLCKREDLFIIGKIWIADRNNPEKAIKETLQKLQLDYLDLYLDHWPSGNNYSNPGQIIQQVPVFEFWPKMEALVDKGLTKAIGISNYNVQSILNLLSFCRIKPVANEVEFHPYYYQENLKKFCDKENITIIAHYPLAHGNGARQYIENHKGQMNSFEEECILDLQNKYGKTPAQIIINWEFSQGIISIPGSSQTEHIIKNIEALDFKMNDEEIKSLYTFGKKMKFCGCRRFFGMNIMA